MAGCVEQLRFADFTIAAKLDNVTNSRNIGAESDNDFLQCFGWDWEWDLA